GGRGGGRGGNGPGGRRGRRRGAAGLRLGGRPVRHLRRLPRGGGRDRRVGRAPGGGAGPGRAGARCAADRGGGGPRQAGRRRQPLTGPASDRSRYGRSPRRARRSSIAWRTAPGWRRGMVTCPASTRRISPRGTDPASAV